MFVSRGMHVRVSRFLGVLSEILSAIVPECLINIQGPEFVGFSYKSRPLTTRIQAIRHFSHRKFGKPDRATKSKMEMEKILRSRSSELLGTRNMELEQWNMYRGELGRSSWQKIPRSRWPEAFSANTHGSNKGNVPKSHNEVRSFFTPPEKRDVHFRILIQFKIFGRKTSCAENGEKRVSGSKSE